MLVLQYKCSECSSFFEYLYGALKGEACCISCGSPNVERSDEVPFYPNKNFCPHDKDLDSQVLMESLKEIMHDKSMRCGGCGVDGPKGSCGSGGGCSGGGGGCKGGCRSKK